MASIAELFREIDRAASAAAPSIGAATTEVRRFNEATTETARSLAEATAARRTGGGGGERPSPAPPGGEVVFGVPGGLQPRLGSPVSSSSGGDAGSGRGGGFQRAGEAAVEGAVSGGSGSATGEAALSSGLQRVEGALSSGFNQLRSATVGSQRAIVDALSNNAAAVNRLASALQSDGGASFRARAGRGL